MSHARFPPDAEYPPPGTKEVIVNGRSIGRIVETGNLRKDLEAATKLLEAAGHRSEPDPELQMYKHAQAFAKVADGLFRTLRDDKPPFPRLREVAAPFVVNATLAIELYLKTLHRLHGSRVKGHSLVDLFDRLPPHVQTALDGHAAANSTAYRVDEPQPFRHYLTSLNSAFADWRYIYEREYSGTINFVESMFVLKTTEDTARQFGTEQQTLRKAAETS